MMLMLIGKDVFLNCVLLRKANMNEGLKTIGSGAFRGCSGLENVVIPSTVELVGRYAFEDCINLLSITAYCDLTAFDFKGLSESKARELKCAIFVGYLKRDLNRLAYSEEQEEFGYYLRTCKSKNLLKYGKDKDVMLYMSEKNMLSE